jgi:hypothetical protein
MTINQPKQPEIELLKNVNALNKKFPSYPLHLSYFQLAHPSPAEFLSWGKQ